MAPSEVGTESNIDPATEEILTSKLLVCLQAHITFTSGVVGNFLLWERSHGFMVTYPIVIRGGGGGWYLNKWSFMKDKNPCSKMGV